MKTKEFSRLALLGMASGLIALGQPGIEAAIDLNSVDIEHLMAKSKCAEHGCASLTAERDVHNKAESDDEADQDLYDDEDDADHKDHPLTHSATPAPAVKK